MQRSSKYLSGILACLLWIGIGCAAHRSMVVSPDVGHSFSEYSTLEVPTFKSNIRGDLETSLLTQIPDRFVKEMKKKTLFGEVTRSQSGDSKTVVMNCTVVGYDKGSRWKRYFIAFGAGRASSTVQCQFVDKGSGKAFSTVNFEGDLSIGFFGGSAAKGTSKGIVKAMVKYMEQNF